MKNMVGMSGTLTITMFWNADLSNNPPLAMVAVSGKA